LSVTSVQATGNSGGLFFCTLNLVGARSPVERE
jgi:hypothetical protein